MLIRTMRIFSWPDLVFDKGCSVGGRWLPWVGFCMSAVTCCFLFSGFTDVDCLVELPCFLFILTSSALPSIKPAWQLLFAVWSLGFSCWARWVWPWCPTEKEGVEGVHDLAVCSLLSTTLLPRQSPIILSLKLSFDDCLSLKVGADTFLEFGINGCSLLDFEMNVVEFCAAKFRRSWKLVTEWAVYLLVTLQVLPAAFTTWDLFPPVTFFWLDTADLESLPGCWIPGYCEFWVGSLVTFGERLLLLVALASEQLILICEELEPEVTLWCCDRPSHSPTHLERRDHSYYYTTSIHSFSWKRNPPHPNC